MGIQAISTGIYGPLPPNLCGLILGRSGLTMKGLRVSPGLIDTDYEGEIKVMVYTESYIFTFPAGTKIAQILLLPTVTNIGQDTGKKRGTKGFGSSDTYFFQKIGSDRPELKITIENKTFTGLLDTGADVTVISQKDWPSTWPLQPSFTNLKGIGMADAPLQSVNILKWKDTEGHNGTIQPYVLPGLPVNLWGRDILSQMGAYLYSPNDSVTNMMFHQNYVPGTGLGRHGQGIIEPIVPDNKQDKTGLGFFP